jgi:hypothetical protein
MSLQTPAPLHTGVYASNLNLQVPGYAHQVTQPYTELDAGVAVPGQKTLPRSRLDIATRRNKTVTRSNEPIVSTITPVAWRYDHWEQHQVPSDILFAGGLEKGSRNRITDAATLNVPQFVELLARLYKQAHRSAEDHQTGLASEFEPIMSHSDEGVKRYMENYREYGERFFTSDHVIKGKVAFDMHYRSFTGLSRYHILKQYPIAGAYMSDDGRDDATLAYRTVNVCWQGPTTYQEVFNYWGALHEGHNCFFILKRRYDPMASTPNKKVYKEFYLQPWFGFEPFPPDPELDYYDDAGLLEKGAVFPVGRVYRAPLEISSEVVRETKAGRYGEAASRGVLCETVCLNMGPSRACLDMYVV